MIENTSVLDKKALIALNLANIKRSLIPFAVLELAIAVLLVLTPPAEEPELVTGLWTFLVAFPLLIGLTLFLGIRRIYKTDKNVQAKPTVHFLFTEEGLDVEAKAESGESKGHVPYSSLNKVLRSKDYLFLFQNAVNAFILDKTTFSSGTADDLVELLKAHGVTSP
jgi:hypothetical protein